MWEERRGVQQKEHRVGGESQAAFQPFPLTSSVTWGGGFSCVCLGFPCENGGSRTYFVGSGVEVVNLCHSL